MSAMLWDVRKARHCLSSLKRHTEISSMGSSGKPVVVCINLTDMSLPLVPIVYVVIS